jgi:hypothetical protein
MSISFGLKGKINERETLGIINMSIEFNEKLQTRESRKLRVNINSKKKSRYTTFWVVTQCSLAEMYHRS